MSVVLRSLYFVIALCGFCLGFGLSPARADQAAARPERTVSVILATINSERAAYHERMLRLDQRLCGVAAAHAVDMVQHNYFDHVSLDGLSPFDRMAASHLRFGYAGENLALDTDPVAASTALWNSIEHRRNLLEPHYKEVGIATVKRSDGEIVVVEDFSD